MTQGTCCGQQSGSERGWWWAAPQQGSVEHHSNSPCVAGKYRLPQHGQPGSTGGAVLSWNAENLVVPLCNTAGSRSCLLPLLLTLRCSLSMLSAKYLLGLVCMKVLLNEYWQVWLRHEHRKGLNKFCHLTVQMKEFHAQAFS